MRPDSSWPAEIQTEVKKAGKIMELLLVDFPARHGTDKREVDRVEKNLPLISRFLMTRARNVKLYTGGSKPHDHSSQVIMIIVIYYMMMIIIIIPIHISLLLYSKYIVLL